MHFPPIHRRRLISLAKLLFGCAILGLLVWEAQRHEAFERLVEGRKDWRFVAAGAGCLATCILFTFLRWHLLVVALDIPVRLGQSLRLAALGFVLNFVSLGSIGGDLFKAILLARGQAGRRTEAVASVLADRVMGLVSYLVLASGAILALGMTASASTPIAMLCRATLAATAVALLAAALAAMPGFSGEWLRTRLERLPWIGGTLARLVLAVRLYRSRPRLLAGAVMLCFAADALFVVSFYLIARGLPVTQPTLTEHFFVVPLAVAAGAVPITPNGLGTMEAAVEALYRVVLPRGEGLHGGGTVVALAHRLTNIGLAIVCLVAVLIQRTNLRRTLSEAEEVEEAEERQAAGDGPDYARYGAP